MSRSASPLLALLAGTLALTACGSPEPAAAPGPAATVETVGATATPSKTAASSTTTAPSTTTPAAPRPPTSSPPASIASPTPARTVASDVTQLRRLGIQLGQAVLIDVADDGLDRFLAAGKGGVVDFTGTGRTDATMMKLEPARVAGSSEATRHRVVIAPPFFNEDLGAGSCVADVATGRLRLATCSAEAANQVWRVVPGGDSGQFELHGAHTAIRVEKGRITTGTKGYVGLQTIPYAK